MKQDNSIITGSVNYNAPTITPTDRFTALTATQSGEYNLKTTEPCTII